MGRTPKGRTRERIFKFVREQVLAGAPPTVREVQEAFGFRAVESAREHLEGLVEEGRLDKEAGKSRGYRPAAGPRRARSGGGGVRAAGFPGLGDAPAFFVPLIGRVQAGALTTALEEPDGYVAVQSRLPREALFALRVRGESMTGAGILPGDVVVVRRQPAADAGEIVVALVEDEATVKRLRMRGGRAELHAENPAFSAIVPRPGELRILGRVVEVRRYLEGSPTGAIPLG
jgi:repressor LexA